MSAHSPAVLEARTQAVALRRYLDGSGRWRSPVFTSIQVGLFLVVGLLPGLPGAHPVFGVPVSLSLSVMAFQGLCVVVSGQARQRWGPLDDRTFWVNLVDTSGWFFGTALLMGVSGRAASVYWVNVAIFVVLFATTTYPHTVHRRVMIASFGALVGGLIWKGLPTQAIFAGAIGTAFVMAHRLSTLTGHRRDQEQAQAELDAELTASLAARTEREEIGRELHDGVAAELTAALWRARGIDSEEGRSMVASLEQTLRTLRGVVEQVEVDPRPATELAEEVDLVLTRLATAGGATPTLVVEVDERVVSGAIVQTVLRALQEGVRNAVNHGAATAIHVELEVGSKVSLRIQDNGIGIADDATWRGLKNLTTRVERLNGILKIQNNPGACLEVELPFEDGVTTQR